MNAATLHVDHAPDAAGNPTHTTTIPDVPIVGTDRHLVTFAFLHADDTRPGDHVRVVRDGCDPVLYRIDPRGYSVWCDREDGFVRVYRPRR